MAIFSLLQCEVRPDKRENLALANDAFRQAQALGASVLIFPETFMASVLRRRNEDRWALAESVDGHFVQVMRSWARQYRIWAIFGMFETPKVADRQKRVFNSVITVDAVGQIVDVYRKTHLYDAFGARESDMFLKGDALPKPVATPFGRVAVEVCYELRFPEISRHVALQGIDVLIVPSAWYSGPLKEMHWDLLLRSRALENTVFVVGANQAGPSFTGGSMIVNPLGEVIARAADPTGMVYADIDLAQIQSVRKNLPCINQTRPELFGKEAKQG